MKLLIVDDDEGIREALSVSFSFQWHECETLAAEDGDEGLQLFFNESPDVVVLDIRMPGLSGLEVLSRIREVSMTPVLMLSGQDSEADIVRALEMGADDYVTKPCSYLELMARIKALLRRSEQLAASASSQQQYTADGLTIRFPSQEVEVNGVPIALTNTEYRLLYHLVRNSGRVVSHRALLQQAWGSDSYGADVVRVYVSRLRSKIEPDPENPKFILTKPGAGYIFAGPAMKREMVNSAAPEHSSRPSALGHPVVRS